MKGLVISFLIACLWLYCRTPGVATAQAGNSVIENPTCELLGTGLYRIDYQASPGTGLVEIFASSWPDRIGDSKPLVPTGKAAPVELSVGEQSGRVYFHLKPEHGFTRVVSVRRLPLKGATNFRDLGGYRAEDGLYVRWGLVYRSGDFTNLTGKDYEYIQTLGLRLVCDLRTVGDRDRSPTSWAGPSPQFLAAPIGEERLMPVTADTAKNPPPPQVSSRSARHEYNEYAIKYAGQYGSILRRLATGELPAVAHCSSGKDRTGLFSAILLTLLGVPREVVIQDYLLTTEYVLAPDSIERTRIDLQRILGLPQPPDTSFVKARMTTRRETIESTFNRLDKVYGSFDNYTRYGLKLTDSELATLRQRLLEP